MAGLVYHKQAYRGTALHLFLFFIGCAGVEKGDDPDGIGVDFTCDFVGEPDCIFDPDSVWPYPEYCFLLTSFGCEVNPVEGWFYVLASDGELAGTSLSDTSRIVSAAIAAADQWNGTSDSRVSLSVDSEVVLFDEDGHLIYIDPGYAPPEDRAAGLLATAYSSLVDEDPSKGFDNCTVTVFAQWWDRDAGTAVPINWSLAETPATLGSDEYSLQANLTHELGHCLGLDDNDLEDTLMYHTMEAGTFPLMHVLDDYAIEYIYGPTG